MRIKRPPLLLEVREGSALGTQVAEALRDVIVGRRVPAGEALPSSRDLAEQLNVARNTVMGAIAQLVDEGLLETRPGAGTFVRTTERGAPTRAAEASVPLALSGWAERLPERAEDRSGAGSLLDLRPGLPDLSAVPFDEWRRSAARKMRTSRWQLASYGPPEGRSDLRREIAQYVARCRGVTCDAQDVIVTNGAQQALDLIARVLVQSGTRVAVEEPGYPPAAQAFSAEGAALCAVPVDEAGLDVAGLPDDAALVYVTPSHQFPTGVTLSEARRSALLAWASRRRAFIVEDDYDSEYRYTRNDLPALRSADPDGRVIYVGTFSKSVMPGIRLGYMIVPPRYRDVFVNAKVVSDNHSANISQAVLADFMSSGAFGRHTTKMRKRYAERHAMLVRRAPDFRSVGATLAASQGGLHACLLLARDKDEQKIIADAENIGIALCGLRVFFRSAPTRPGLVIGFGNVDTRRFEGALDQIVRLLR